MARVSEFDINNLASKLGLSIQHDCGGYRVVRDTSYVFPDYGICPTATRRECYIFLKGMLYQRNESFRSAAWKSGCKEKVPPIHPTPKDAPLSRPVPDSL